MRSTLEVEFYSIAERETVPEDSEFVTDGAADPVQQGGDSPLTIQWSVDAESTNAPHLSTPPGSPVVQGVEFATPPTGQSIDSEGVSMRYRTVTNLFDTTEELTNLEYSGVCFIAAEEPRSVEAALSEQC